MSFIKLFLKVWINVTVGLLEGVLFFWGCALTFTPGWHILGFTMLTSSLAAIIAQAIHCARKS